MKKIVLAALLISANTLADAGDVAGDFYVFCEPVKNVNTMEMDPVNGGFLKKAPEGVFPFGVYLDASEMSAIVEYRGSAQVCNAFKSSEFYMITGPGDFIDEPFTIDRKSLGASGRFFSGKRTSRIDEYQCNKIPISKDVKI